MRLIRFFLALTFLTGLAQAQIAPPQINLSGDVGAQGFPVLNSGTLIFSTDASRAMTAQETSATGGFKVTGTWTANRTLTMPAGRFQFMAVENATTGGFSLILASASGGTSLTIPNGQTATGVWFDGTNVVGTLQPSAGYFTGTPTVAVTGTPTLGQVLTATSGSAATFQTPSSSGVASLNSLTGAVTLAAGANTTITPSGNTLTIASTGGGSGSGNPSTCTSNSTGNKCLGVSPYLAISGDYTLAIQQAITDLNSDGGGTLWVPCHATYPVAGALQDPTGANAQIVLPPTPLVVGGTIPIRIAGMCNPNVFGGLGNAVLQTTLNTANGSFIGGFVASGPYGGFINSDFILENIQLNTTATNPAMVMVNAKFFPSAQLNNVTISSSAPAVPTATTGIGYISPVLSNNVSVSVDHLTVAGFYKLAQFSEHMHIGHLEGANSHLGYVFDTEPGTDPSHSTWGNTISADYLWCQLCDYEISAGVSQTTVNIQAADFEVSPTGPINDPNNLLLGDVYYNVPYNDGRSTSTIYNAVKNGGANLRLHNLKYPGIALLDGTGKDTAVSSGASTGKLAWYANSLTPDVTLSSYNPFGVSPGYSNGSLVAFTAATGSPFANFATVTSNEPAVSATLTTCTLATCYQAHNVGAYPNWISFQYFPHTWGSPSFITQPDSGVINTDTGATSGLVLNAAATGATVQIGTQSAVRATIAATAVTLASGVGLNVSGTTALTGVASVTNSVDVPFGVTGGGVNGVYSGLTATSSSNTWYRHVMGSAPGSPYNTEECQWNGSVHALCWSATNLSLPSTSVVGFVSGIPESSGIDTGLSRDSAGVVDCGNGTAADKSCTFKAATGTFSAALTVGGNNVCQSTGTNCPASYASSAGGPSAYTATLTPAPSSLTTGLSFSFNPNSENAGTSPTMNLNSLGAKTITKCGTIPLSASGDLVPGAIAWLSYDGTEFQLINPQVPCVSGGYSLGSTPASAVPGAGAGTGGTASVTGLDGSHLLTVTAGTSPSISSTIVTVTFSATRGHMSYCVAYPADQLTAALGGSSLAPYMGSASATTYTLQAGTAGALTATNTYHWNVSCP